MLHGNKTLTFYRNLCTTIKEDVSDPEKFVDFVCGMDHIASLKEMIWRNETTLLRLRKPLLDVIELNLEEMK
jgi:hypothetical protein